MRLLRTIRATFAVLASAAAIAVGGAMPAAAARPAVPDAPAYFQMTDVTGELFTVKMTDPEDIRHARELLDGTTDQMPHIFGRIVKRPAPFNPRWSYYIEPQSVQFFDVSIEVCDATIPYVEEHLDEVGGAFLPGAYWCDWSSRLVREVPA